MSIFLCKECGREFKSQRSLSGHIRNRHHITVKEYYDKYLKKSPDEGICFCGNPTIFLGTKYGYSKHCSCKCSAIDEKTKRKREETNQKLFGVNYPAKSEQIKEKTSEVFMEKYGVPWGFQSESVKEKIETTLLDKYGVRSLFQLPEVREKAMNAISENIDEVNLKKATTSLANYGETSWTKTDWGRAKMQKIASSDTMIKRKSLTMHKNNSFSFSIPEELLYKKLILEFGVEDVFREYFCERYPYKCDFYIKSIDTFIEYNGFWHHGEHWFDKNSAEDVERLSLWIKHAKTSENYKKAVKVWSIGDIEKRETAKKNKLNYIVLWNVKDIENLSLNH